MFAGALTGKPLVTPNGGNTDITVAFFRTGTLVLTDQRNGCTDGLAARVCQAEGELQGLRQHVRALEVHSEELRRELSAQHRLSMQGEVDRRDTEKDAEFPDALVALEDAATTLFRDHDFGGMLRLIQVEGQRIWLATQARGLIAGSDRLDQLCLQVGQEVRCHPKPQPGSSNRSRRRQVYAVSELYREGGHTRVLEDLIGANPGDDHHLIWISGEVAPTAASMAEFLRVNRAISIYALYGEPIDKLRWAFRLLAALDPDVLVHLGHPNDPVSLALMLEDAARRLVMIHHCDCSFALGRSLPGVVHVTLGRHFQQVARNAWGLRAAFLPLTCLEPSVEKLSSRLADCSLVTATSGSAHKFDLGGDPSYLDILMVRFSVREGTHFHFGPLSPEQIERIEKLLDSLGWSRRFVHVPHVPHLAAALKEVGTALYIDSYPVGGGRAIVEAMAAALPICAACHDPNLDGFSFCYPDCLTWSNIAELRLVLTSLETAMLERHSALSRCYFEANHASVVFKQRLDAILSEDANNVR